VAERLSWSARALAAVGLLAVGGACALAMTSEADPDLTRAVSDDQLVVPVVAAVSDGRLEVSVELSWQPGRVLRAPPGWAGIVTAVTPPADGTLDEGDRPFAVGGVDRIVIATTAPLVNPVKAGATGPDVLELRGALTRLGLLPPDSGGSRPERADNEFMRALAALGTSLRAPGTAPAFDPSWLIWTGGPAVTMDLLLEVGEAAPSAGTPIASEGVRLTSAAITQDPPLGGGQFVVSVDELDPVKLNGRAIVPEELAALGDGPGGGEGAKVVFLATEGLEMGGDGELVGRAEDTVKMGGGGRFAGRHCGFLLENKNAIGVGKGACQRSPRQRLPVLERPLPTPIASKSG